MTPAQSGCERTNTAAACPFSLVSTSSAADPDPVSRSRPVTKALQESAANDVVVAVEGGGRDEVAGP